MGKLCSDEELAVLQNYKLARNRQIEMENGSSGRNGDFFFYRNQKFLFRIDSFSLYDRIIKYNSRFV